MFICSHPIAPHATIAPYPSPHHPPPLRALHSPPSCNSKYINGQTKSVSGYCSAYREYIVDVSIAAASVTFMDDYCGTLSLAGETIGATAGGLYVYVGADNDAGTSAWNKISIWGAPAWDVDGTRAPSRSPSHAPSGQPVMPPTPNPTVVLGPAACTDAFLEFDDDLWLSQCVGCAYEGGSLKVSGDSMLQRTVGSFNDLTHVRATLTKDSFCNDHGIVVSTIGTGLAWNWGSTVGSARFVWK